MTSPLPRTTVEWNGLTLGWGTPWVIDDPGLTGWLELPPTEKVSDARADSYGDRDTPLRARGRTVSVAGHVNVTATRDELVAAFGRATTLPADPSAKGELVITTAGTRLTAFAQVQARKIVQGSSWGIGRYGWAVQFVCDDYVRYGDEITVTAPLVIETGGVTPPLVPPITLDPRAKSGVVEVFNPGDRLSPAVIELQGPQIGTIGVEQITTNRRLTYTATLAAAFGDDPADVLTIDTRQGWAKLNGDSTRSPLPGSAVTRTVGLVPGVNQLRATGKAPGGGNPRITVRFRPAYE